MTIREIEAAIKALPVFSVLLKDLRITYDVKSESGAANEDKVRDFESSFMSEPSSVPPILVHREGPFQVVDDGRTRFNAALRAGLDTILAKDVSFFSPKERVLYAAWLGNEQKQSATLYTKDRIQAAIMGLEAGATSEECREVLAMGGVHGKRAHGIVASALDSIGQRKRAQYRGLLQQHSVQEVCTMVGMDEKALLAFVMPTRHRIPVSKKNNQKVAKECRNLKVLIERHFSANFDALVNGDVSATDVAEANNFYIAKLEAVYLSAKQQHNHYANKIVKYQPLPQAVAATTSGD